MKKGKSTKKAKKQEKPKYVCEKCGLIISVDEVCGCVDACDIICCGEQMKPKK
ncbi:MAG: hypothetical protein NZ928_00150 [Endomicrobia bacterium]|nr:hypothetical protein [Endomicrobiia bacterium]MCX7941380.1 hypothetical protein [Endomicrobiia bacterium]MDW8055921.1 hypothetical protein [Elusimicrobiota bacterium]